MKDTLKKEEIKPHIVSWERKESRIFSPCDICYLAKPENQQRYFYNLVEFYCVEGSKIIKKNQKLCDDCCNKLKLL